ncbi:hypothetical protein ACJX0J_028864 [Zea mays]
MIWIPDTDTKDGITIHSVTFLLSLSDTLINLARAEYKKKSFFFDKQIKPNIACIIIIPGLAAGSPAGETATLFLRLFQGVIENKNCSRRFSFSFSCKQHDVVGQMNIVYGHELDLF